jgi:hypothetical protein
MAIQIEELNERILEAVGGIVEADPSATILVMSDHGARHHVDDVDEHFRIFFAARPGALNVSFGDDVAAVNVFRRLLSAVLGARLDDLPYEAWESDWSVPLSLNRHH